MLISQVSIIFKNFFFKDVTLTFLAHLSGFLDDLRQKLVHSWIGIVGKEWETVQPTASAFKHHLFFVMNC